MHDQIDDIARQAHQGSVAAIIQTLNEKLADTGIRTRAIFNEGVLQLLCEAARVEQLEQSVVVEKIRQILEAIAPRKIRRIKINSRIVQEQQLLWLDEIKRNPEKLLWSQEITIVKPNPLQRLSLGLKSRKTVVTKQPDLPTVSSYKHSRKNRFWRGIFIGVSLSLFAMFMVWWLYRSHTKLNFLNTTSQPDSTASPSNRPGNPSKAISSPSFDPFAEAVRLAEEAAAAGQTAQTAAQWLDLAAKWQRASDLMNLVTPDDENYQKAQDRVKLYQQYSDAAQAQARQKRS